MSNTAIIYRYQTLDSFQRGIYYTITAGKTAVTLRGSGGSVRLRRLRVIKPFPDGVIPM